MTILSPRQLEALQNYAAAERSDPFCLSRAISHTQNGIASYHEASGEAAFYSAEATTEMRAHVGVQGDTQEYPVKVYFNRQRP